MFRIVILSENDKLGDMLERLERQGIPIHAAELIRSEKKPPQAGVFQWVERVVLEINPGSPVLTSGVMDLARDQGFTKSGVQQGVRRMVDRGFLATTEHRGMFTRTEKQP